jgi:hypothetical protein
VKELLAPYGSLKSFNLVMDKNTGKSKVGSVYDFLPVYVSEMSVGCYAWGVLADATDLVIFNTGNATRAEVSMFSCVLLGGGCT